MKHLLAFILITICATASFADDTPAKGKKGKAPWQVMKLKKAMKTLTLTAEQETGFAEAVEKYTAKVAELETAGLTKDKLLARSTKRQEGLKSGLKGKKLQAHVNEGLSEETLAMFKKYDQANRSVERAVAMMLTDEQLSSLPEKAQGKMSKLKMKGKGGKGKGKKKKMKEKAGAE